jgi:hypothetical protein
MPTNLHPISHQKNKMCSICESFLVDWLQVPIVNTDYFFDKIHYKRLKRFSNELSKELMRIVTRITPLVEYMMNKHIERYKKEIQAQIIPEDFALELIPESIWLSITNLAYFKTFDDTDFKGDLDYICTRLEEEGICKYNDFLYEFIGHCLQHVMTYIPSLHQEHTGRKMVTYGGPPIGVKVKELQTEYIYISVDDGNKFLVI